VEFKANYITVIPAVRTPVVDFSASLTNPIVGQSVSLTDKSKKIEGNYNYTPTTYLWEFSPNTKVYVSGSSSTPDCTVQFTAAGTYQIKLTGTNSAGNDVETKAGYIIVTAPSATNSVQKLIISK
jgi:PKD repeat protein